MRSKDLTAISCAVMYNDLVFYKMWHVSSSHYYIRPHTSCADNAALVLVILDLIAMHFFVFDPSRGSPPHFLNTILTRREIWISDV